MRENTLIKQILSWIFLVVFVITGVLNLIFVHPAPGMFYLLLACLYLPATNAMLQKKIGLTIPFAAKIIVGLVILWGTLAVGDLAEILGL
jgi:hypothetical protein